MFYTNLAKASVVLRLIFGPTIFWFPRITALFSFMLDWVDGELYKRAGYSHHQYGIYDKALDYYWYVWIFFYVLLVPVPYRTLFVFLFVWRTIGQLLYFKTRNRIFFFIFPNVFEIFFLYYLVVTIPGQNSIFLLSPYIWIAFTFIVFFVMIREAVLHIENTNMSGFFTGKTTYWPKVSYNAIKIFGFIALVLAVLGSYSFLNRPVSYKSQAVSAQKNGVIVSYESAGTISGWIRTKTQGNLTMSLFSGNNLSSPQCELNLNKSEVIYDFYGRSVFIISDPCFARLHDGAYHLLIKDNATGRIYAIDFGVVKGKLMR